MGQTQTMPRKKVEGIESVDADPGEEDALHLLYMHRHGYITTAELLSGLMNRVPGALRPSIRKALFGSALAVAYFGLVTGGFIEDHTGILT